MPSGICGNPNLEHLFISYYYYLTKKNNCVISLFTYLFAIQKSMFFLSSFYKYKHIQKMTRIIGCVYTNFQNTQSITNTIFHPNNTTINTQHRTSTELPFYLFHRQSLYTCYACSASVDTLRTLPACYDYASQVGKAYGCRLSAK